MRTHVRLTSSVHTSVTSGLVAEKKKRDINREITYKRFLAWRIEGRYVNTWGLCIDRDEPESCC